MPHNQFALYIHDTYWRIGPTVGQIGKPELACTLAFYPCRTAYNWAYDYRADIGILPVKGG